MPTETAQLLCTAVQILTAQPVPYQITHRNHRCNVWVRSSWCNAIWTVRLGICLCEEYTYRYGKIHKCQDIILQCYDILKDPNTFETMNPTPFVLAMPDQCKTDDPVESYRNCYRQTKRHIAQWKRREIPWWYE